MQSSKRTGQLGSKALFAALSVSTTAVYAQPSTLNESDKTETGNHAMVAKPDSNEIEMIEVYGMPLSPYRATRSGDKRRLADLVDTPQTITVLTQKQILESGKSDLKEVLATQSGVTLGTGENGNAFGDRYIIRGHEARSDVFVDGLRDPGMTTRESFATEQIEITKGPSSTFAGRGSSGGAINSITKQASPHHNVNRIETSVGSDSHYRVVVDANAAVNTQSAVRINLLKADETVPDREGIERSREGALLSGYYAPTEALRFIADGYYLKAEDVPDLGSYFDRDARHPLENIPVYAQQNDFLDTEVKVLTLRTEYDVSDTLQFYNATRWGETSNGYITTGMRGTTRDESDTVAPFAGTLSLSTHQGWQEVDYVATQFNLIGESSLFGRNHQWVLGLDYSNESVDNGVYDIALTGVSNCRIGGRRGVSDGYCIVDGNGQVVENARSLMQREFSRGDADALFDIETTALYLMNTLDVAQDWEVFFGVRYDRFDYQNEVNGWSGQQSFDYSDSFTNGHLGVVYDLNTNGNVYLTFSTASNINGGESDVGGSCGYGGLCGSPEQVSQSDPERVKNIELGTKWALFDERLLATAAVFQITKSDVMESVGDAYSSLGTLNTGKNRVEGVEVSLAGAINDEWSIQLSASVMDSEVLESFNQQSVGLALSNFADKSAYAQLRYQPNDRFAFGGAVTYKGEMYGGQPDTAAGFNQDSGLYSIAVPSYAVFDLFANYYYSDNLNFRLNIGNVSDQEYWTAAYRSGAFMYLGEARSVRATVSWQF